MNLRKGLVAAATALTVSATGVGVASADVEAQETSSVASSSIGADTFKNDDGDNDGTGEEDSDEDSDETTDSSDLSSAEGMDQLSDAIGLITGAIGLAVTVYGALKTFDII